MSILGLVDSGLLATTEVHKPLSSWLNIKPDTAKNHNSATTMITQNYREQYLRTTEKQPRNVQKQRITENRKEAHELLVHSILPALHNSDPGVLVCQHTQLG